MPTGPDLITNGDFATGDLTGWTVAPDGSFEYDTATAALGSDESGTLSQTVNMTAGRIYTITFDYVEPVSGSFSVSLGGTAFSGLVNGANSGNVTAGSSNSLLVCSGTTAAGSSLSVTNITCKETAGYVPIIEQIARHLAHYAGKVTVADGFKQTLTAIRPKRLFLNDEITADLTTLIFQEDPTPQEITHTTIDWQQPFSFSIICIDSDTETDPIDTRINTARSDLEKKLMEDISCGGWAYDLQIQPAKIFNGPNYSGVNVTADVFYRTQLTDPYTQG